MNSSEKIMESAKAIQIITPVNHEFQLQEEDLKKLLNADEIKDRQCVVISIAGAFRKGKSFLLNFFLKYLYAQYQKHDVTDWIGERTNGFELNGFTVSGSRRPETIGIWMWSEIFTHDFENGEKIAIILLDTQGIFDNRSSPKDCAATFAISMMLSSVQCYNVSQNIQEDDLQNLELFTEYGRLALQQSNQKPFQKLLFIVRDWPYATENEYGDGQNFINELLAERIDQTNEMHQLRRRIKSSFDKIRAFLMPYPGEAIATGRDIEGDLRRISPEFIKQLKVLVPLLFAPENLVVKKIGGKSVRAHELPIYLRTYINIFNGGRLPEPKTVMEATAATQNVLLYTNCLESYIEMMERRLKEKSLKNDEPFFSTTELHAVHQQAERETLSQFQNQPKLGSEKIIKPFADKLIDEIKMKYIYFKQQNDTKRNNFQAMAKADLHVLYVDCFKLYVDSMQTSIRDVESFFTEPQLKQAHDTTKDKAFKKFDDHKKLGGDEHITTFRSKLDYEIEQKHLYFKIENERKQKLAEDLKTKTEAAAAQARAEARAAEMERIAKEVNADSHNIILYNECLNRYISSVRTSMIEVDTYYDQTKLQQIHTDAKSKSLSQAKYEDFGQDIIMLESRLENEIDMHFTIFRHENDQKRSKIESAKEKAEMQRQIDELQSKMNTGGGDIWDGILEFVKKTVVTTIVPAILNTFSK